MPTYEEMLKMPHEYFKCWLIARSYNQYRYELLSEMIEYEKKAQNLKEDTPEIIKNLFSENSAVKVGEWLKKTY